MTRATEAFAELVKVMQEHVPACRDDLRFILDDTRAKEVVGICHRCPAFPECETYAQVAKPKGGIWAGKRWTR